MAASAIRSGKPSAPDCRSKSAPRTSWRCSMTSSPRGCGTSGRRGMPATSFGRSSRHSAAARGLSSCASRTRPSADCWRWHSGIAWQGRGPPAPRGFLLGAGPSGKGEESSPAEFSGPATKANARGPLESRVERNVEQLLDLLSRHTTRATFFTLGEIAVSHPSVVRRIAAEGHEIACHGDHHEDVYRLTPQEFRADIRRAKAALEDLVGDPVIGYRAPNFSIRRAQSWAHQVLFEEGFRYDSSKYPILHDRYGDPSAPRFPYEIWRNGSAGLIEFPVGTARILGVKLPIGGGGYFRLSPRALVRRGMERVNAREQQPVRFYLHPWELEPGQPGLPMACGVR